MCVIYRVLTGNWTFIPWNSYGLVCVIILLVLHSSYISYGEIHQSMLALLC